MNILLCPDKFKGSLTAEEVCSSICKGLLSVNSNFQIHLHPLADGGDGSVEILKSKINLQEKTIKTVDPLGRAIDAHYHYTNDSAFIELANASGLVLLHEKERNPRITSTFGTGLMIKDALDKGLQKIYLFIGGSATNDGGIGIAHALGYDFLDENDMPLNPIGDNLRKIYHIRNQKLYDFDNIEIVVLCDVINPMTGVNGAAFTYAEQKGASSTDIKILEEGLIHFNTILGSKTDEDLSTIKGMGAAGAVGASLVGLLKAKMQNGFQMIAEITQLEKAITNADFVITGEGKIDSSSFQGKVVGNVIDLCEKHNTRCGIVSGVNSVININCSKLVYKKSVISMAENTKDSMHSAKKYLEEIGSEIGNFLKNN